MIKKIILIIITTIILKEIRMKRITIVMIKTYNGDNSNSNDNNNNIIKIITKTIIMVAIIMNKCTC